MLRFLRSTEPSSGSLSARKTPKHSEGWKLKLEALEDRSVPAAIHHYDAALGTLPESQGFTSIQDSSPPPAPTVSGGVLHQSPQTVAAGFQWWQSDSAPLDFATTSYVLEADLQVLSSNYLLISSVAQRSGYYLWPVDSAGRSFAVGISSDGIVINTDLNFDPSNGVQFKPFTTTDRFHTYRLVIANGEGTLFIDGDEFASATLGSAVRPDVANRVLFGEVAGVGISESELRHFSFGTNDSDIHMLSAQLQSGNTVQFAYETTGNPGPFQVGLYRSTDGATYTASDRIGDPVSVTPNPNGGTGTSTSALSTPWTPDSSKPYIVAVADPDSAITELREDNNAANIALPDLVAKALDYSITHEGRTFSNNFIPVDSNVTVTTTIWNRGIGGAGAFKVTLFLSTDAIIDPATDHKVSDFDKVISLLPGATTQLNLTTTLPSTLSQEYAGLVWLGVVVDSAHDMPESNEQNNFNQTTGDRRIVRMWDPLTTFSTLPVSFATLREAERYLRNNGFERPVRYDIGWSKPVGPMFSRFNGKLMPAGAFRIQAIPAYNSSTGRWVIQYEGPEPSPRTVLLLALQPQYGVEWLIYVYRYHEVVD